jgi:flagellar biosynthesis component FlhA
MLVTKAGIQARPTRRLFAQLSSYPSALGMSAFLMVVMAALPGHSRGSVPVAGGPLRWCCLCGRAPPEGRRRRGGHHPGAGPSRSTVLDEPISTALSIDAVRIELGYGLLGLINAEQGHRLTDQIKACAGSWPARWASSCRPCASRTICRSTPTPTWCGCKEIEAGRGDLRPNMLLVMDPRGDKINLAGEETVEPTFGLPAMWVDPTLREEALFRGYTVVDPSTVITTHLTELIKDNMSELLSHAETQKLLDELPKEHQKLVADLIPGQISVSGVQRVLQSLLGERVSIRDLPNVLEGVSEACGYSRNVTMITEHVRARLARQISDNSTDQTGVIPILTLSPEWEHAFTEALHGDGEEKQLVMAPTTAAAIHPAGAPGVRAPHHHGREPGAADQPGDPALRALDHRAVPPHHHGDVAERDPCPCAHPHAGPDLRLSDAPSHLHRTIDRRGHAPGAHGSGRGCRHPVDRAGGQAGQGNGRDRNAGPRQTRPRRPRPKAPTSSKRIALSRRAAAARQPLAGDRGRP